MDCCILQPLNFCSLSHRNQMNETPLVQTCSFTDSVRVINAASIWCVPLSMNPPQTHGYNAFHLFGVRFNLKCVRNAKCVVVSIWCCCDISAVVDFSRYWNWRFYGTVNTGQCCIRLWEEGWLLDFIFHLFCKKRWRSFQVNTWYPSNNWNWNRPDIDTRPRPQGI